MAMQPIKVKMTRKLLEVAYLVMQQGNGQVGRVCAKCDCRGMLGQEGQTGPGLHAQQEHYSIQQRLSASCCIVLWWIPERDVSGINVAA